MQVLRSVNREEGLAQAIRALNANSSSADLLNSQLGEYFKTTVGPRCTSGMLSVTHPVQTVPRKQQTREMIALDRQGTRQQRPESPAVTQLGMRVNTWYINSTKGRSPKTDAPSGIYTFHFRHTRRQRCVQVYERTKFLFLEKIMQETLHDHKTSISIGSRPICNLQFADDIDLIHSNGELRDLTDRLVDRARAYEKIARS